MRLPNPLRRLTLYPILLLIGTTLLATPAAAETDRTFVRLGTDAGEILLVMSPEDAPRHVQNFLQLGLTGFYTDSVFHRVIPGFMIQGGDPNSKDADRSDDGTGGPQWKDVLPAEDLARLDAVGAMLAERGYVGFDDRAQLKQEFNATRHIRGTLSMARSQHVDSAGSQFFICVARATNLDNKYTAFGQTVIGLEVLDSIVNAPRNPRDYPDTPVGIRSFIVIDGVDDLTEAEQLAWQELQGEAAMEESRP